jgi:DNA-binding response OmpR family regulator
MLGSLLLSRDTEVFRILRPTLEKLSIEVEVCQEARQASEILLSEKFDAVIIDCDDLPGGIALLEALRSTPSNKSSVTFAIVNGKKTTTQQAFGMGVNFVLHKPLTTLNASRCFNAALGFMLRERRRYFRYALRMPVTLIVEDKQMKATSTDISEGGIALLTHQALPKNSAPHIQFSLPGISRSFEVETEVAWADLRGRVGLRFIKVPSTTQIQLETWLNEHAENASPISSKPPATPAAH